MPRMSRGRVLEKRVAKVSVPKALQRSEHDEQRDLFAWAEMERVRHPHLALMFAVPNGARTSMSVAKRLKAEGLRKGVPDIVLPVARGGFHGLFVEMKRQKATPSAVNEDQRNWHFALMSEGYAVHTCRGFEQARTVILEYLTTTEGKR